MENGDETLASPAAAAENPVPNGGVAEADQPPVTHAAKSYAAAADNSAPNGGVAEDEQAPVTHAAKSYAAVAAHAEIEDLRAAKLDLQERLTEARRENKAIAAETHRIEGTFMQAREEVIIAEDAAASLRAEVERLQHLLEIEKGEHEMDKRSHKELAKEVEDVRQEKLKLEEEIKALKASAAAATAKEREAAPAAEAPKEVEVAWQGMAAAAAAGAAATAAVVLIYLRLKR